MKISSYCYVPKPGVGHPEAFLENILAYSTAYPLVLYSEHLPYNFRWCENPEAVKHPRAQHWISNFAFLAALRFAIADGVDYMLYLEADCRVRGDNWDVKMVEEFQCWPNAVAGGSPVCYNIASSGHAVLRRAISFASDYLGASGFGMPIYGFMSPLCLYPNGAGSIFKVGPIATILGKTGFETDLTKASRSKEAWDLAIGFGLWAMYGVEVFDRFAPLTRSYSGCTDSITTEPERIAMLESGQRVLVHQIKSNWTITK